MMEWVTNSDELRRAGTAILSDILMKDSYELWVFGSEDLVKLRQTDMLSTPTNDVAEWITNVRHITSVTDINVEEIRRIAADDEWRRLVVGRGGSRAPD